MPFAAVARSQSTATQQPAVLADFKNLERERDEAVATAEVCVATARHAVHAGCLTR